MMNVSSGRDRGNDLLFELGERRGGSDPIGARHCEANASRELADVQIPDTRRWLSLAPPRLCVHSASAAASLCPLTFSFPLSFAALVKARGAQGSQFYVTMKRCRRFEEPFDPCRRLLLTPERRLLTTVFVSEPTSVASIVTLVRPCVSQPWQSVSNLAKDFIQRLLASDPDARLSASQAARHPWMVSMASHSSSMRNLHRSISQNLRKRASRNSSRCPSSTTSSGAADGRITSPEKKVSGRAAHLD